MSRRYFGTDGIRGRVGEDTLSPEFMVRLGWATGRVLGDGDGSVLIGKDTRISGYLFESALEAGLAAAGVNCLLTGPMPTPAIAYLTRTFHARAGIVISASHNLYHDNGVKFFSADGNKLPGTVECRIEDELKRPLETVPSEQLGRANRIDDAPGRYIEFCKSTIPLDFSLHGLKLVLDCAHGATYQVAPKVFRELGAEVFSIGVAPDGLNINAGCGSTQPEALQAAVIKYHADVGVALDGDGDRAILVDRYGQLVDGDEILYIIATSRQAEGRLRGSVVGTAMTNLGLEHALAAQDISLERTNVGDRYIIEKLLANDWNIGGEPSGHIICRDRTTTGDGTIAALQVLSVMANTGFALDELCAPVEKYPQELVNVHLNGATASEIMALEAVRKAVADVEQELAATMGRVLLRPSGTEPLIRIMVEGRDNTQVKRLSTQLAAAIEDLVT